MLRLRTFLSKRWLTQLKPEHFYNRDDVMTRCPGCGAPYHACSENVPGYVPDLINRQEKWLDAFKKFANDETKKPRESEYKEKDMLKIEKRFAEEQLKARTGIDEEVFDFNEFENGDEDLFPPELCEPPKEILCVRCHSLSHKNQIIQDRVGEKIRWTAKEKDLLKSLLRNTDSLVIKIVDMIDFPSTWVEDLAPLVGSTPIIVVGNKVDLLPECDHEELRIKLKQHAEKYLGTNQLLSTMLISAKKKNGVKDLISRIVKYRRLATRKGNVFLVGQMNSGKSTLWNSIQSIARRRQLKDTSNDSEENNGIKLIKDFNLKQSVTVSNEPGTTIGFIKTPLSDLSEKRVLGHLIDTPGFKADNYFGHILSFKEMNLASPKKVIPFHFKLKDQKCLLIGGLCRVEFSGEGKLVVTTNMNSKLPIHLTDLFKLSKLTEQFAGKRFLVPPIGGQLRLSLFPDLVETFQTEYSHSRILESVFEVVLPGIGFFSLSGNARGTVKIFTPQGITPIVRQPLFPKFPKVGKPPVPSTRMKHFSEDEQDYFEEISNENAKEKAKAKNEIKSKKEPKKEVDRELEKDTEIEVKEEVENEFDEEEQ